jgi:multimeric flavodoxin WrbA
MNKKVLIISSSARKGGNSDTLCDQFLLGANEAGNSAEKIFLKDKKINYCTGCGFCTAQGHNGCVQKDDMPEILDKMIEADVIVMATPVYFYTMNGQMKTFIDRVCAKYTKVNNKEFYFIATAADSKKQAVERTMEEFRGFTYCLEGATEKGIIHAVGVWNREDVTKTKYMSEAYEMGKKA